MKTRLSLLTLIFCISIVPANTSTQETSAIISPINKIKSNSKKNRKINYFLYSNKLYKVNSFCKLIQAGNYSAVQSCINKGFDLNRVSNKLTPLMYAARHNRADIVKLLIENGAKLKTQSNNGYTALKWAELSNASESYNLIYDALKKNRN